ncbi:MAG: HDOD domain-containing protein [Gammaproteobacteria bacterium]|nr:HDOD domain-containing protein [Gammaproteobacteria bacterium]
MPASLTEWVKRLEPHILPAMPLTVQRVRELMQQARTTHADYQRLVARDPGFTLAIYRHLANLPRPPREPVTHLAHAVSLAGLAPLEAAAESVPLLPTTAEATQWSGLQRGYARAAHAAGYALELGSCRGDANPDELMVAALLSQCGELALWSRDPARMQAIERRTMAGEARDLAAVAELGTSLSSLNIALADAWSLPSLAGLAQPYAGAFQPRSLAVMLATALARSSERSWGDAETLELIELSAEYCSQPLAGTLVQMHRRAVDIAQQLHGLPLPVTAAELLMLPGGLAAETAPDAAEPPALQQPQRRRAAEPTERAAPPRPNSTGRVATAELIRKQPPAAAATVAASRSDTETGRIENAPPESVEQRPRAEQPQAKYATVTRSAGRLPPDQGSPEVAKHPGSTPPPAKISPHRAVTGGAPIAVDEALLQREITKLFQQLRNSAGLTRVMFVMTTPDGRSLRPRFVTGADKEAPLRRLRIDLGQRSLFTALLAKSQCFWLHAGNRDKYQPTIPRPLQQTLDMRGFFAGSIHFGGRPVGLIYADSSTPLDKARFDRFKEICKLLQQALARDRILPETAPPPYRNRA